MPTHFHFLVRVSSNIDVPHLKGVAHLSQAISKQIQTLLSSYTKAINKRYNRHGSLFQQNTKAKQVASDSYLITLLIYIHQNPIRSGLVKKAEDWLYSSYQDYIDLRNDTLPSKELILGMIIKKDLRELTENRLINITLDVPHLEGVAHLRGKFMKIELKEITVRELAEGYKDNAEVGVIGYGGRLDIRPPYHREFIYKDKQRDAVIDTTTKNFPLNAMYWHVREPSEGSEPSEGLEYEIIDCQQRTISICQYVNSDFSFNNLYIHNLQDDKKEQILNYKLMVYFCSGTDSERLDWFRTINIAGEKLTEQELRTAVFRFMVNR